MNRNRFFGLLAACAAIIGVVIIARTGGDGPAPSPTTTSTSTTSTTTTTEATTTTVAEETTTTAGPPTTVVTLAGCTDLQAAKEGAVIQVGGDLGKCDLIHPPVGITVTGTAEGNLACVQCHQWTFDNFDLTGTMQFLGGDRWVVQDSHFDGADAGVYGVLSVSLDIWGEQSPTNWKIVNTVVENPGANPGHNGVQDHAFYANAAAGVNQNGLIDQSEFHGSGAGPAVKIGGTGNGPGDSANGVTLRDSLVTNTGKGGSCVLIATSSSYSTIQGNTLDCPESWSVSFNGPWTGTGMVVSDNVVTGPWFLGLVYNDPFWGPLLNLTHFVTPTLPDCGGLATCTGNTRR